MNGPMKWTIEDILRATGGMLLSGDKARSDREFTGISIDSRKIAPDKLFIAIRGEVHDGHSFVNDVIRSGVRGIVIHKDAATSVFSEQWREQDMVCVGVSDTTTALGDLAAYARRRSRISVVAVTGSNGKTTTRGMTSAVVSQRYETLSTKGNLNNLIGLPLILLTVEPAHQWAVLELGMNRPGEIGRLGDICQPDIGVITNIAPAHLEGFDSIEGITDAKGELLRTIAPGGTVVLNADDPRVRQFEHHTSHGALLYGRCHDADICSRDITMSGHGLAFELVLPTERVPIRLAFPGYFMVSNALAAAAVGYRLGLTAQQIKTGLESFRLDEGRMNVIHTPRGIHLIDDTYNANPGSMESAIVTLGALKGDGRAVLVAGDMLELGESSEAHHRTVGSIAVTSGVKRIYATGSFAESVSAGARDEGLDPQHIVVGTQNAIMEDLTRWLEPGDWVLIKGSRKIKLETLFHALRTWAENPG